MAKGMTKGMTKPKGQNQANYDRKEPKPPKRGFANSVKTIFSWQNLRTFAQGQSRKSLACKDFGIRLIAKPP